MVAAVPEREAEQPHTFSENALTPYVDHEGMVRLGFRLDPAKNLPTLDAIVEPPPTPADGWPEGTVMVDRRPVMPMRRALPAARRRATPAASGQSPVATRAPRRGPSRERRSRSTRRTRAASRGDPDSTEGDGEPSPAPAQAELERPAEHASRSNSQKGEGFFGAWSVDDRGPDTVSYAFRPTDQAALDAFAALPAHRLTRRERGESRWATQYIDGGKLGMFPRDGLLVFEGRLAPLLSGDPGDSRLASPQTLAEGADRARQAFASLGVVLTEGALVRRLDLAAEIRFEYPADGLLLLLNFGGLQLATRKQDRRVERGQTRSVSWKLARGVDLRLYDAGVRHGTDPPGARVRLERQVRWQKAAQLAPESFTERSLAALYLGPLSKLVRAAPTMHVLAPRAAERHIVDLKAAGEISLAVMERLIGMVRVIELGQDSTLWDTETASRRRRELTKAGLSLDDETDEIASGLDVHAILVALAERWATADGRERATVPKPTEDITAATTTPTSAVYGPLDEDSEWR
jgi:hypothetical protein